MLVGAERRSRFIGGSGCPAFSGISASLQLALLVTCCWLLIAGYLFFTFQVGQNRGWRFSSDNYAYYAGGFVLIL